MPSPVVLMKQPSALPRSTTFVSPVTSSTPAALRRGAHRRHDPTQIHEREPLLEDEPRAQIQGPRPCHRDVVHRAIDGEGPDVPTGKKSGLTTYESVVNASRAPPTSKHGLVVQPVEIGIPERGQKVPRDEIGGHLAAASMPEQDALRDRRAARGSSARTRSAQSSEDIVFSQGDVHQIPDDVIERHMGLLDRGGC